MKKYPLGRNESPPDPRDFDLKKYKEARMKQAMLRAGVDRPSWLWPFLGNTLDQGIYGHCVGFNDAHFLICDPVFTPCTNEDGKRFYYEAKKFDFEPEQENGSTIRSGAKVLQKFGYINNYAFARDMETIEWWICNVGPMCFGTPWYTGMFNPDSENIIHLTGVMEGGHAWLGRGFQDPYIYGMTSWGDSFADRGTFRIHKDDFAILFGMGSEALTAVELDIKAVTKPSVIELIAKLFKSLCNKGDVK